MSEPPAPEVVSAAYYFCRPDWTWQARSFQDLDLWFAFDGTGYLQTGRQVFRITPGMGFLFTPGDEHVAWNDPESPLSVCAVHFTLRMSGRLNIPSPFVIRNTVLLKDLLDQTIKAFQEQSPFKTGQWFSTAILFLQEEARPLPPPGGEPVRYSRIEQICAQIRQHPEAAHTVPSMAAKLNMSTDHFTRLFGRLKGTSPRQYLVNSRIAMAQHLLSTSDEKLEEVARLCGYASVQFFCRQFKSRTGTTPGRYRSLRLVGD